MTPCIDRVDSSQPLTAPPTNPCIDRVESSQLLVDLVEPEKVGVNQRKKVKSLSSKQKPPKKRRWAPLMTPCIDRVDSSQSLVALVEPEQVRVSEQRFLSVKKLLFSRSPKRKTSKKRRCAPQKTPCIDGADSNQPPLDHVKSEQVGVSKRKKANSLSPKQKPSKKRRCSSPTKTPYIDQIDSSSQLLEQVGVSKQKHVKSLATKRKTSKRPRCAPLTTPCIDRVDLSQKPKKSASTRRKGSTSKSKKIRRRKLQEAQKEVGKLKSIQDRMEKYQAELEEQHRDFQRQIQFMDLRNRELESHLEELFEENDRLWYDRKRSALKEDKSSKKGEIEFLRFDNQILRSQLDRCQLAFLRSTKLYSR